MFFFCFFLGKSGVYIPYHLLCRVFPEDCSIWISFPCRCILKKLLEHSGLCLCIRGVSTFIYKPFVSYSNGKELRNIQWHLWLYVNDMNLSENPESRTGNKAMGSKSHTFVMWFLKQIIYLIPPFASRVCVFPSFFHNPQSPRMAHLKLSAK